MSMPRLAVWATGLMAWFTCYALSPQEIAEKALESVVVITATAGEEPEEAVRLVETALQLFSHYEDALLLGGQLAMQAGELERTKFTPSGKAPHHWGVFLELSEDDPDLEKDRAIAIQHVKRFFPYLLD